MTTLHLTEQSLAELAHLLPPTALALVRELGPAAALALVQKLPGVQVMVPRDQASPSARRRWALLQGVVGHEAMTTLVAEYGGNYLEVPNCLAARQEQRNRWLRQRFDVLTRNGQRTKSAAVCELGMDLALAGWSINYRQIERCIDQTDLTPELLAQLRSQAPTAAEPENLPLFPLLRA